MIISGILFGAWPLLMNRSGLHWVNASIVLLLVALALITPFFWISSTTREVSWGFAIAAGCASALGIFLFNSGFSQLQPENTAPYFMLMLMVQVAVPALYHVYMNGVVSLREGVGFCTAIITALLLVK